MKNQLVSQRLQVNAGIMAWYVKELTKLTEQMTKECTRELTAIYKRNYTEIALDESISSQIRIALNALYKKYGDKFDKKECRSQLLLRQYNFNCD